MRMTIAQKPLQTFALAEKENFPLNQSELHLRSILLENGVIRFENGKLVEGAGALLSISQESTCPSLHIHGARSLSWNLFYRKTF